MLLLSRSRNPLAGLALLTLAACRNAPAAAPPRADFVLSAGDSAFWVTSSADAVRVRSAPLELAHVDGRFYELYVADDDRSYENAGLVGQRVYRRDLVTGDSLLIYEDTVVPGLAGLYARLHPGDRRLHPNDEPSDDPLWTATATLDLGEVHGAYVSFSMHTDVERDDAPLWHTSRRGVLDLRHGGTVTLATIAGPAAMDVGRRRDAEMRAVFDSVRGSRATSAARAVAMLPFYQLDPASFSLTTVDGSPAVAYGLPGAGGGDAGHLIPLPPIRIGEPAWWADVAATLPIGSSDGRREVWRHGAYEVVVRYDSLTLAARLVLRDSTSREWTVGRVPAPATRIFWLDRPAIDSAARHALARAFDESSLYDEAVRTATFRTQGHRQSPRLHLARHRARPQSRARPAIGRPA